MKLTIHSSFQESISQQHLIILVDSEQLQNTETTYSIESLNTLIESTQYKAELNETLALINQTPVCSNSLILGLGKTAELQPAKLAKIAQTIIKASQKKFKQISVDISTLPEKLHYLFALNLTQAS